MDAKLVLGAWASGRILGTYWEEGTESGKPLGGLVYLAALQNLTLNPRHNFWPPGGCLGNPIGYPDDVLLNSLPEHYQRQSAREAEALSRGAMRGILRATEIWPALAPDALRGEAGQFAWAMVEADALESLKQDDLLTRAPAELYALLQGWARDREGRLDEILDWFTENDEDDGGSHLEQHLVAGYVEGMVAFARHVFIQLATEEHDDP